MKPEIRRRWVYVALMLLTVLLLKWVESRRTGDAMFAPLSDASAASPDGVRPAPELREGGGTAAP